MMIMSIYTYEIGVLNGVLSFTKKEWEPFISAKVITLSFIITESSESKCQWVNIVYSGIILEMNHFTFVFSHVSNTQANKRQRENVFDLKLFIVVS